MSGNASDAKWPGSEAPGAAAVISLRRASFGYSRSEPILSDITLEVLSGEYLALIGPNGAGKTTLLKAMSGLIRPLSGEVVFCRAGEGRKPGYVPQQSVLDPLFPLTVYEVVLMGLAVSLPLFLPIPRWARRRVLESLEKVGLADLRKKPFSVLSGGQKQRALIARALVNEPEMMFLDEPTSGVDAAAEAEIMEVIERLNRQHAMTVVLVSHHLKFVRAKLQQCVVVADGAARKAPTCEVFEEEF